MQTNTYDVIITHTHLNFFFFRNKHSEKKTSNYVGLENSLNINTSKYEKRKKKHKNGSLNKFNIRSMSVLKVHGVNRKKKSIVYKTLAYYYTCYDWLKVIIN